MGSFTVIVTPEHFMMVNEVQKRSRELEKSGWKFFKIHFSEKGLRAQGKSGLCQPFRSLARHPELLIKKNPLSV